MTARSMQEVAIRCRSFENPVECSDGNWLTTNTLGAAFFLARGSECIGTTATRDKNKTAFVIKPRGEFEQDLADWKNNGTVPIRDLHSAIQFLRALLRFRSPGSGRLSSPVVVSESQKFENRQED
jgi:hypothetical protein